MWGLKLNNHNLLLCFNVLSFIYQGGLSSGYKNFIADKGLNDETYAADSIALFRMSGTSVHNNKVVQVDAVRSICGHTVSE